MLDSCSITTSVTASVRYHKDLLPKVGDLTFAKITEITGVGGVKCALLEYGGLEAFIPLSDISKRRTNNAQLYSKLGMKLAVVITNVDSNRGFIDATKKGLSEEEREECKKEYNSLKKAVGVIERACEVTESNYYDVMEQYGLWEWNLPQYFTSIAAGYEHFPTKDTPFDHELLKLIIHNYKVPEVRLYEHFLLYSQNGDVDDVKKCLMGVLADSYISQVQETHGITITIRLQTPNFCAIVSGYCHEEVCKEVMKNVLELVKKKAGECECNCDDPITDKDR